MSTLYNRAYQPPFPQLQVMFRFEDQRVGPFSALLDSGADVTLVPESILEESGAWQGEIAYLRSQFGEVQPVRLYLVTVQVESTILPGIYVVGHDTSDEIILGRDVLNKIPLFLDGPELQTDLLDDATAHRLRTRRA